MIMLTEPPFGHDERCLWMFEWQCINVESDGLLTSSRGFVVVVVVAHSKLLTLKQFAMP